MEEKSYNLCAMVDCSRNAVMNLSSVKRFIDCLSVMGYKSLQLYTEDTYEIKGEPYFGYMRGRYTQKELKEIDVYAREKGIELVPCVQTLAHLNQMLRWSVYDEIRDFSEILLIDEPKTYEFLDRMFENIENTFTSRKINIGFDEAVMVGMGQYLKKHGFPNKYEILLRHLKKVSRLLEKHHLRGMMWSDMLFTLAGDGNYYNPDVNFKEEVLKEIPQNIDIVYWDYYTTDSEHYEKMIKAHKKLGRNLKFAGGAWSWIGFTPHNSFSIKHLHSALEACEKENLRDIIVTLWGDDGKECSYFSLLPTLFYVACYARGIRNMEKVKEEFSKLFKIEFDDFIKLDLPDILDGESNVDNPSKYLLYNDPLCGLFDCYVFGGESETYKKHGDELEKVIEKIGRDNEFCYLFESGEKLCRVLELKAEIGVRGREAYRKNNLAELEKIYLDYVEIKTRLSEFYEKFRRLWFKDNKNFGFEIQDIRLGGLIKRMENCAYILKNYLDGKIDRIEEFEQDILNYQGRENKDKKRISYNSFIYNVSANRL